MEKNLIIELLEDGDKVSLYSPRSPRPSHGVTIPFGNNFSPSLPAEPSIQSTDTRQWRTEADCHLPGRRDAEPLCQHIAED